MAVSYLMKRKIKNIFLEIISNTKIFYINFFNENANDQDFAKITGGLDKGRLDNVEYCNTFIIIFYELMFPLGNVSK